MTCIQVLSGLSLPLLTATILISRSLLISAPKRLCHTWPNHLIHFSIDQSNSWPNTNILIPSFILQALPRIHFRIHISTTLIFYLHSTFRIYIYIHLSFVSQKKNWQKRKKQVNNFVKFKPTTTCVLTERNGLKAKERNLL